ncbi:hypothetical protein [Thermococcus thermotolerans]|uniref:hypothetical protein n=1 Tax=Thermococcus thermotolerans TaxID=2969672 RepID=UPI002157A50B|nr:hypothetical protein [Thermococcus thermotolerans]
MRKMRGMWKDKIFWGTAGVALLLYAYGIFLEPSPLALVIGSVFWAVAFLYLLWASFRKKVRKILGSAG